MDSSNAYLQQVVALMPTLRAFGRSLCGDPAMADDLVQETVLRAWLNRSQFQSGRNLQAWLLTILRNRYFSELRHRKFEVEDPDGRHAASMSVPPEHEVQVELDELSHAFGSLRAHQQQALLLVCGNGLSYMQAARACNCAVGTIRSRIARARDHLTRLLHMDELPLQSTLASAGLGTTNAQALP